MEAYLNETMPIEIQTTPIHIPIFHEIRQNFTFIWLNPFFTSHMEADLNETLPIEI